MTWKDDRLREINVRGRRYRRELETEWVRASANFRGVHPNGRSIAVAKGRLIRRNDPVVEKYAQRFEALPALMVENRVKSLVHRLRVAGHVE